MFTSAESQLLLEFIVSALEEGSTFHALVISATALKTRIFEHMKSVHHKRSGYWDGCRSWHSPTFPQTCWQSVSLQRTFLHRKIHEIWWSSLNWICLKGPWRQSKIRGSFAGDSKSDSFEESSCHLHHKTNIQEGWGKRLSGWTWQHSSHKWSNAANKRYDRGSVILPHEEDPSISQIVIDCNQCLINMRYERKKIKYQLKYYPI